jgi:hypothetical protein
MFGTRWIGSGNRFRSAGRHEGGIGASKHELIPGYRDESDELWPAPKNPALVIVSMTRKLAAVDMHGCGVHQ